MKLKRLVFAILPLLLLSSCSSTLSSITPQEKGISPAMQQAYDHLQQDDLKNVTLIEYHEEGENLYYRSAVWNGEEKIPSLFLTLAKEDKTGKEDYSQYIGPRDYSLYRLVINRKGSETISDCLYVQNVAQTEEEAGYIINSEDGKMSDSYSYIFEGLSEDAAKETASIRKEVAAVLEKQEFLLLKDPIC